MTDEWTFLYGFFVGQLVLMGTVWFLLRQFILTRGKQKYEPLSISRRKTTEENIIGNELDAINFVIKQLHDSTFFENALTELSLYLNQTAPTLHPLLNTISLQAIQLEAPPHIQRLKRTESGLDVGVEWTKGPFAMVKGEIGRYGLYLPFSAKLSLQLFRAQGNIQVNSNTLTIHVGAFDFDLDSHITVGHAVQLNDTQGLLKEILDSLIKRHSSQILSSPIQIPIINRK